ncbi:MAG: hypothetical protein J2P17_12685 [Mycobacterium sp.]|nr:hypothetical protein [Mycobacterium sp.]
MPVMSFLRGSEAAWATVSADVRYPMRLDSASRFISFAPARKLAQGERHTVQAWAGRGRAPDGEPHGKLGAVGFAP